MNATIDGRQFEWDDAKNKINKIKHGINFKTAARVFSDPYRIEKYDDDHSQDEDRWQTIGMVDDVLFVVYTKRAEKTRLISAREAEPNERERYYGNRILLFTEPATTFDGRGES